MEALRIIGNNTNAVIKATLLSFLGWVFDIMAIYAVFLSMGWSTRHPYQHPDNARIYAFNDEQLASSFSTGGPRYRGCYSWPGFSCSAGISAETLWWQRGFTGSVLNSLAHSNTPYLGAIYL